MSADVPVNPSTLPVVVTLNDEWRGLAYLDVPVAWREQPALDGLSRVREILALLRSRLVDYHRKDEVLLALATISAQEGQQAWLARRVLLQAMLGKAVLIARNLAGRFGSPAEAATHVVGCLYEVIATYPVHRRPGKGASNLSLDTLKRAIASSYFDPAMPTASLEGIAELVDDDALLGVSLVREALAAGVIDVDDDLVAATVLAPGVTVSPRGRLIGLLTDAVRGRHLSLLEARALVSFDAAKSKTRTSDAVRQRRSRGRARVRAALPMLQAA